MVRLSKDRAWVVAHLVLGINWVALLALAEAEPYPLDVFPREDKIVTDSETGVTVAFLTTHPAADVNLYFHERSWLADSSLILFYSSRENGGLMGYLVKTRELVRICSANGEGIGAATAAVHKNSVYALHGQDVCEFSLSIEGAEGPLSTPSRVYATERVICTLPRNNHTTALNESCDGKRLALGISCTEDWPGPAIYTIEIDTGRHEAVVRLPKEPGYEGHVQWSRTNPNWLSFAGRPLRLQVVDVRDGTVFCPYKPWEGELITHECWWVNDQILFCGGIHASPGEESHVKVLDVHTGQVRIIGAGSWWPGASAEELAKHNWWHASGSEDGKWVAADNWHGDIVLFEGHTTRPRLLTTGHRTYGVGEHPHVGWGRKGGQVIFASHKLGDLNVCVATIPESWEEKLQLSP